MAINGTKIIVYAEVNSTYTAIASTKTNDVQTDVELIEVSSPTTGTWKQYRTGRKEWKVNVGTLVASAANIEDLLKVGTTYKLQFRGSSNTPCVQGSAILKTCNIKAARGSLVQGAFVFQGNSELVAIPSTQ